MPSLGNFEIIGEAANWLPETFKDHFPEIDWHRIRGFRNRIIHDYFGIDYSIVWTIKENFLPRMILQLKQLSEQLRQRPIVLRIQNATEVVPLCSNFQLATKNGAKE